MREQRVVHTPCPLNSEQRVMCATRARELASRSAVPAAITLRRLACACGRPVAVVALCSLLPLLRVLSRQLWPRLSPFDVVCAVCESERGSVAGSKELFSSPSSVSFVHSMSTAGGVHSRGVVAGQPGQGRNVLI